MPSPSLSLMMTAILTSVSLALEAEGSASTPTPTRFRPRRFQTAPPDSPFSISDAAHGRHRDLASAAAESDLPVIFLTLEGGADR